MHRRLAVGVAEVAGEVGVPHLPLQEGAEVVVEAGWDALAVPAEGQAELVTVSVGEVGAQRVVLVSRVREALEAGQVGVLHGWAAEAAPVRAARARGRCGLGAQGREHCVLGAQGELEAALRASVGRARAGRAEAWAGQLVPRVRLSGRGGEEREAAVPSSSRVAGQARSSARRGRSP